MTVEPSAGNQFADAALTGRQVPARLIAVAALRVAGMVGATLLVYGLLPIEESTGTWVMITACIALIGLGVAFAVMLTRISRSPNPLVAGVEALCLVFGLFLSLFAFIYVSLSAIDPQAFSAPLDKVAGIYFSMTILATVGFGDISAATDSARIAVTVQMVLDMILIGAALKLLAGATRRAVERVAVASTSSPQGE